MNIYKIKCPNCDANLDINDDEGLDFVYCKYCGYKCAIDYDKMVPQINYTKKLRSEERKIDKKYSHEERVLEMEYEEKKRKDKDLNRTMIIWLGVMLLMVGILMFRQNARRAESEEIERANIGNIQVKSHRSYEGKNYEDIASILKDMGFENIECVELKEKPGLGDDPGEIKEVLIDGDSDFQSGDYFPKDVAIKIYYYAQ